MTRAADRILVRAVAVLLLGLLPLGERASADALDGVLEVQSAFMNVNAGVYQLHARIRYPVNEQMAAALRDGVSLSFSLDAAIERSRRLWLDAEVTSLTLRRELTFHTVSERYVVRDARSGEQATFPTLDAALENIGTVEGWPVLVASQLRADGEYSVRVRAGMRRGKLPDALRVLLFWTDDWQRESEWYSWSLPR